tara:strand:- start:1414 stop:4632 length:3219 start_codon:yes stop_codon:yes gene_type:complete
MRKNEKILKSVKEKIQIFDNFSNTIEEKLDFYQETIKKTILSTQKYKSLDIMSATETNICFHNLESLMDNCIETSTLKNEETVISNLQKINNSLYDIFKSHGTKSVSDIIAICYGNNFVTKLKQDDKFNIIEKYINPISFKVFNESSKSKKKVPLVKNKIIEDFMIVDNAKNLECFDLGRSSKNFQVKVSGIKFVIKNESEKKTLIINGICEDLMPNCFTDSFFKLKLKNIRINKPKENDFNTETFDNFVNSLSIKELFIYDCEEIYLKFVGTINQINIIKQKAISQIIKDFLTCELFNQRKTIIQLLINYKDSEFQYLAYLLYDLLSNDSNGTIDTQEQTWLFDSLPWNVKKQFRIAMKQTIQYTNKLINFDTSKIPLEQQICLLKAGDNVKEKAMTKLKEIKAKNDDTGSKARQYLEGLLKIPFGIYRKEPILCILKELNIELKELIKNINLIFNKSMTTTPNIYQLLDVSNNEYLDNIHESILDLLIKEINKTNRNTIIQFIININKTIKTQQIKTKKINYSNKKLNELKNEIKHFVKSNSNLDYIKEIINNTHIPIDNIDTLIHIPSKIKEIKKEHKKVSGYVNNIKTILDNSVHGHNDAKRQIERIIGQWISGELDGYCFGFEGPPGVGKTSLAKKGISNCLVDENNEARPFSFIAVGGSSNGSTFEGHNYTYVGSTWGKIADVVMDSKCMNPIIYVDELDKISKTEHGKEIIGILTHLIDSTQNNCFQDKYFSGIDLDLSKALFIFSYNDPSSIDKILLDRIHRVNFKNLDINEKIIITHKYLIPEINKKMGLENVIHFTDSIIEFIINKYTYEAGVRQLKQHLFEIIAEINLNLLTTTFTHTTPYQITEDDIKNIYLKNKTPIKITCKHSKPMIGIINGLWANASGKGGIIPIEAKYYATNTLLELKLTGSQGDVMKESMNVSKTLAWNLTTDAEKKKLLKRFNETKNQGIHIHCPEGSVPKDGPSAGTAITVALYSLFTGKKINNDLAITGEITLQGKIEPIGGLELKILGGIKGGITTFLYPKDNDKDFKEFMKKYGNNKVIDNITFKNVDTIKDVLTIAIEK